MSPKIYYFNLRPMRWNTFSWWVPNSALSARWVEWLKDGDRFGEEGFMWFKKTTPKNTAVIFRYVGIANFTDFLFLKNTLKIFCYRRSWKLWQQQFPGQAVESYWHPVPALPHVDVHARQEGGRRGGRGRQQLHLYQQQQQQQHQQQQQPDQHQQWPCPSENKSASLPHSRRRSTLQVGFFWKLFLKFVNKSY